MTPEEIQKAAVDLMQAAAELTIGLAESEEEYDLSYIASQLAKCSSYGERVADMLARLTQLRVFVMERASEARNTLEIAQDRAFLAYEGERTVAMRDKKIAASTRPAQHQARAWDTLDLILREIKADISRRGEMIKRMDSDLRLHEKILEAKITAGALNMGALTGDPRHKGEVKDVISLPDTDPDSSAGEVDLS